MNNYIDFRMIQKYGLSLNDKKKYHIVYCSHTWSIFGVYDDLDKAIEETGENPGDKGFEYNLNVWELLEQLGGSTSENMVNNRREPNENDRMLNCWFIDKNIRKNMYKE
jgi:hypothetical protein